MQLFFGCHKHFTSLKVLISKDISHQKYFNVHHVHIIKNKLSLLLSLHCICPDHHHPAHHCCWWSGRKNIKNFATSSINRMLSHDELFLKNITYTFQCVCISMLSFVADFLSGNWPHTTRMECDWYNIDLFFPSLAKHREGERETKKANKRSQAFL